MPYINTATNEYPISEAAIRAANPERLFPAQFQAPDGFALVFQSPAPPYDPLRQTISEAAPALGADGRWYQSWVVKELAPEIVEQNLADAARVEREQFKLSRQEAVDRITVQTASGNVFDGDEVSQNRMARAVIALQGSGQPSVTWILADNTVIQATWQELAEALALAGAKQAELWVGA